MGNVTSVFGDPHQTVFLKDQSRFFPSNLSIFTGSDKNIFEITPGSFPSERYNVRTGLGNDDLIEYVQDPTVPQGTPPIFLLQLPSSEDLFFKFSFILRQSQQNSPDSPPIDTSIQGLTFVFASTQHDLDNLITREFHADPNIHKNPQVELLGDYSTGGSASVQGTWTWRWKPPKNTDSSPRGWRTICCFVEYNHHTHKLDPLATFSIWVRNTQFAPAIPRALSPLNLPISHSKLRIPSVQSTGSASDAQLSAIDMVVQAPSFDARSADGNHNHSSGLAIGGATTPATSSAGATASTQPLPVGPLLPSFSPPEVPVKVDLHHHRPVDDFCNIEDGPIFRSAMKSMEHKTSNMKVRWKKALKRAEEAHEAHSRFNEANIALIESLKEISMSSTSSIQPAIEHYFKTIAKRIQEYENRTSMNLQRMVIEPISKYYNYDIKQAESKRKDFEDESREYYAYVARYLGARHESQKEKKRVETDTKYQTKRRHFELKRFDYSSFIQDLHGGRKDQEVLSNLTKYAEAQANDFLVTSKGIEALLPELKALIHEVNEADKDFKLQRSEREEKRRALETVSSSFRDMDLSATKQAPPPDYHLSPQQYGPDGRPRATLGLPARSASSALPASRSGMSSSTTAGSGFEIPSQKSVENGLCHREGILWAASRTGPHIDAKSLNMNMNKPAMHPYWVVLDQGILAEYKKWQETFSSHPDQVIDIRVASAREHFDGKSADSQLCFTVIAPNLNRTYQTTSNEEMKSWVAAINRAAQSALAENNSVDGMVSGAKSGTRPGKDGLITSPTSVRRHATVGTRAYGTTAPNSEALMKDLQAANGSNRECADCSSTAGVTWAVINYGIVVCIKCSGVHRSLGSHISKVRSLTLDSTAFTVDVVALLKAMGNKRCNDVLEHLIAEPTQKLTPAATDEQRKQFILSKYSDHAFSMPLSGAISNPNELLLHGAKTGNILQVLQALCLKADPNYVDGEEVPVFYHALAATAPATAPSPIPPPAQAPPPPPPPTQLQAAGQPPSSTSTPAIGGAAQDGRSPQPMTPSPYTPGVGTPVASPIPQPSPNMSQTGAMGHASPPSGGLGTGPLGRSTSRTVFVIPELLLLNGAELPNLPCPIRITSDAVDYLAEKQLRKEATMVRVARPTEPDTRTQKRASVAGKLSRIGGRREIV